MAIDLNLAFYTNKDGLAFAPTNIIKVKPAVIGLMGSVQKAGSVIRANITFEVPTNAHSLTPLAKVTAEGTVWYLKDSDTGEEYQEL